MEQCSGAVKVIIWAYGSLQLVPDTAVGKPDIEISLYTRLVGEQVKQRLGQKVMKLSIYDDFVRYYK